MTPNIELRDYFAAQILAGKLANPDLSKKEATVRQGFEKEHGVVPNYAALSQKMHAEGCYQFADAMLAAREKQSTEQSS